MTIGPKYNHLDFFRIFLLVQIRLWFVEILGVKHCKQVPIYFVYSSLCGSLSTFKSEKYKNVRSKVFIMFWINAIVVIDISKSVTYERTDERIDRWTWRASSWVIVQIAPKNTDFLSGKSKWKTNSSFLILNYFKIDWICLPLGKMNAIQALSLRKPDARNHS